jgi:hypothetical protein
MQGPEALCGACGAIRAAPALTLLLVETRGVQKSSLRGEGMAEKKRRRAISHTEYTRPQYCRNDLLFPDDNSELLVLVVEPHITLVGRQKVCTEQINVSKVVARLSSEDDAIVDLDLEGTAS